MICPDCGHDTVDVTTRGVLADGFEEYQCPHCGAHWEGEAPNTITHATGSFIQDGWMVGDTMEVPTEMLPAGWPESESEAETTQYRIVEITAEAMTIELLR